ncbi:MAG: hypothetical protein LBU60_01610 [Clostridiales bacterium]|jgi:hypothetical protein|nr:hypothetical protein [Clostridiales bacterium]
MKHKNNVKKAIESTWENYSQIDYNSKEFNDRLGRYKEVLDEIPARLDCVCKMYGVQLTINASKNKTNDVIHETDWYPMSAFDIEHCALQLRKICEAIIMGAFIINGTLYEQYFDCIKNSDSINYIKSIFSTIGLPYYPQPMIAGKPHMEQVPKCDYLAEEDFVNLYKSASEIIHLNIDNTPEKYQEFCLSIDTYIAKIIKLTNKFIFTITGTTMLLVQINEDKNFDVYICDNLNYEDSIKTVLQK